MECPPPPAGPNLAVPSPVDRPEMLDPDRDLVPRLLCGEREALRGIYERHGARVHRLCLRLLGCAADAEDATQEVFLKLFERASAFDGRARFSTWLHRFTVNLCLHRLERERLRAARDLADADELVDPGERPEDALGRDEARAGLERLLRRLSPEHRAILVLRELEGLSYQELAETLALPTGTVMSRLARAREQLVRLAAPARDDSRPVPGPILHQP